MEKVDLVRVLRVIEYIGPRPYVERQIESSLHGTFRGGRVVIRAATVGEYPEVLSRASEEIDDYTRPEAENREDPPITGPDGYGATRAGES